MTIEAVAKTIALREPTIGLAVVDREVVIGVRVHSGYCWSFLNVFVKISPDEFDELAARMLEANPTAATKAFERALQANSDSNRDSADSPAMIRARDHFARLGQ